MQLISPKRMSNEPAKISLDVVDGVLQVSDGNRYLGPTLENEVYSIDGVSFRYRMLGNPPNGKDNFMFQHKFFGVQNGGDVWDVCVWQGVLSAYRHPILFCAIEEIKSRNRDDNLDAICKQAIDKTEEYISRSKAFSTEDDIKRAREYLS